MTTPQFQHHRRRGRARIVTILLAGVLTLGAAGSDAATRDQVRDLVAREAARNPTVPTSLALAVARVESNFKADALSSAGARGVMQIMPATARDEFGVDPEQLWEPRTNVRLGIRYLARLYKQYDRRWELALSHYNGGTLQGHGGDAVPHDYTRDYVKAVMHYNNRYARQNTRVQLASAADHTKQQRDAAGGETGARLTEHPSEYMVFDDAPNGDDWRGYLEAADYWLASSEKKAEIRRERREQKAQRDHGEPRFTGSRASSGAQADRRGTRNGTNQADSAHGATQGRRDDGRAQGQWEPVSGETTGNRFTRVSPEVKRLREKFQAHLHGG